ncbi:MHS family MFS transporter [Pendulispora rubella]|uniref:MHS family MFS transporter n=1 Tax=Pendulispora rubella TaxID=2741070 RepID=A0ABZ2L8H0_9BACT
MSNVLISPDTTAAPRRAPDLRALRRVVGASFIGTAIEWYDYFIYGSAAALVFARQFFPQLSPVAGTLAAFATYSVGFLARPLGGVLMGHFGDRAGRKSMLVLSLMIMGLATAAIGLLPTYATAGIWAPILLVALRFIQGLAVGGEWGGAVLMAVEHAPPKRRGFYGSFPQMGVPGGLILANLVFLATSRGLGSERFDDWGWRLPFLASFVLVAVGLAIRLKVEESPDFAELREGAAAGTKARAPILEVLRTQWKTVLLAGGAFIGTNAIGYIFMAYVLSYATKQLGFSRDHILRLSLSATLVWLVTIPWAAALSDRHGRRRVVLVGSMGLMLWAAAFFPLIDTRATAGVLAALVVMAVALGLVYGPQAALFAELFAVRLRYSGVSLGYQIGAVLGGGIAPTVATALFAAGQGSWPITVYLTGVAALSLGCLAVLTRNDGQSR